MSSNSINHKIIQDAENYLRIVEPLQQLLHNDGFVIFNITRGVTQNGFVQFANIGYPNVLIGEVCSNRFIHNNGGKGVSLSQRAIQELIDIGFSPPSAENPNYSAYFTIENNDNLEAVASMIIYILETLYQVALSTEVDVLLELDA